VVLIVNADDFGLSPTVNNAVMRAFELGLIDRATAIANAPCFADACGLALANGLEQRVGIHFNITEGIAISPEMKNTRCFCAQDSRFTYRRNSKRYLSKSEKNAAAKECEAQIRRFHEQRLFPTHLDSHHHVHTEWSIFRAIEPVLRRHRITSVRLSRNVGKFSIPIYAYKTLFNSYLRRGRWSANEFFGDCSDFMKHRVTQGKINAHAEVMTHPGFDSHGLLIDVLSGEELAPQIEELKRMYRAERGYER
jgi:hypothetical protein